MRHSFIGLFIYWLLPLQGNVDYYWFYIPTALPRAIAYRPLAFNFSFFFFFTAPTVPEHQGRASPCCQDIHYWFSPEGARACCSSFTPRFQYVGLYLLFHRLLVVAPSGRFTVVCFVYPRRCRGLLLTGRWPLGSHSFSSLPHQRCKSIRAGQRPVARIFTIGLAMKGREPVAQVLHLVSNTWVSTFFFIGCWLLPLQGDSPLFVLYTHGVAAGYCLQAVGL